MTTNHYAEVLLARRRGQDGLCLTYALGRRALESVPSAEELLGAYVLVPLGTGLATGHIVRLTDTRPEGDYEVREIQQLLTGSVRLGADLVGLGEWMADRTCAPLVDCLQAMLPAGAQEDVEAAYAPGAGAVDGAAPQASLFADEDLGPESDPVLKLLASADGPMTTRELQAVLGSSVTERALDEHVRKGALERAYVVVPARTSRKTLLALALSGAREEAARAANDLPPRAKAQIAILLDLAKRSEPMPLVDLGNRRAAAMSLVERGLAKVVRIPVLRSPGMRPAASGAERVEPTSAQREAIGAVCAAIDRQAGDSLLLYGVTGSGKTEVYLAAIEHALGAGGTAIVLVPEISLTPQTVGRFKARFGEQVAVLHSQLGAGERLDEWTRARDGEASIVIGPRSAVFAPVPDLRLIVMDEEHERSYKQESSPRYHARDVAAERARRAGAALLLGSATPSLESYQAALDGRHELLTLSERVAGGRLPGVEVVDMRKEPRNRKDALVSEALSDALQETVARGEQAILLLNRRGWSPFLLCRDCGEPLRCDNCDVSLTYHQRDAVLRCHHCDYEGPVVTACPTCGSQHLHAMGTGTERAAEEIRELVPDARVLRMDRDTTTEKGAHGRILGRFERGEADVLIGTQMIAKGLDFPRVTLVGVILADVGLHFPDFRAAEHTFSLLAQVAGRAGRRAAEGRVLVQTFCADHWAIGCAARHDFEGFFATEIESRRRDGYPPFMRLANIVAAHEDAFVAEAAIEEAAEAAEALRPDGARVLGPAACPIMKLRGKARFHVELFAPADDVQQWVRTVLGRLSTEARSLLVVDMDPLSLM